MSTNKKPKKLILRKDKNTQKYKTNKNIDNQTQIKPKQTEYPSREQIKEYVLKNIAPHIGKFIEKNKVSNIFKEKEDKKEKQIKEEDNIFLQELKKIRESSKTHKNLILKKHINNLRELMRKKQNNINNNQV